MRSLRRAHEVLRWQRQFWTKRAKLQRAVRTGAEAGRPRTCFSACARDRRPHDWPVRRAKQNQRVRATWDFRWSGAREAPTKRRRRKDANHKNYRRVHPIGVSRRTASMFYSPVSFCAADASTPARSESESRIAHTKKPMKKIRMGVAKEARGAVRLRQHLLRQEIPAEGDTAAERDRGKVAALGAFAVRP